jgi:peptidyl-prolyl cis-trans isomerase C
MALPQIEVTIGTGPGEVGREVSVDGVTISEADIALEMQYHPAPSLEAARRAAAEALVVRQVLLREADRLGIEAPAGLAAGETADEARIRLLMEREARVPEPDSEACRTYYEHNRERFRAPDLYEVSHILLAAAPADIEARDRARTVAQALLAELREAPERFEALARAHSACPSRATGGSLGQVSRGQTVPEFEAYLARAEVGVVAPDPVETRYGYHVVYLHRRVPGEELPFDRVADRIADYLRESVTRRAVAQYLRVLLARARVQGIALDAGPASPLVQ